MENKTNILKNLNTIYDNLSNSTIDIKNCRVVKEIHNQITLTRNLKRYKKFIDLFETFDDDFINLLNAKSINEIMFLRMRLNQYLYFLRRNKYIQNKFYLTIKDLRYDLTEFFNREKQKLNDDIDAYKNDTDDCLTIYELRRQYKRLKICNHNLNVLDDDILTFVINKPYTNLLKFYRDLNEYLLLMRHQREKINF
jgi:hypothetical protein